MPGVGLLLWQRYSRHRSVGRNASRSNLKTTTLWIAHINAIATFSWILINQFTHVPASNAVINFVTEPLSVVEYNHLPLLLIFMSIWMNKGLYYSWYDALYPNVVPGVKWNTVHWGKMALWGQSVTLEYWISNAEIHDVTGPWNGVEYNYLFHNFTPVNWDRDNAYSWKSAFYRNVILEAEWNMVCRGQITLTLGKMEHWDTGQNKSMPQ